MASLFSAVDRVAARSIDAVYGEAWQLIPKVASADPNAAYAADVGRDTVTLFGVYVSHEGEMVTPNAHDPRTQHRPGATLGHPGVDFDLRDGLALVRRGDVLIRTGDASRWRVHEILPDVDGRRRMLLNAVA